MPRAKRPLAEADPNASNASNTSNKSAKIIRKAGERYGRENQKTQSQKPSTQTKKPASRKQSTSRITTYDRGRHAPPNLIQELFEGHFEDLRNDAYGEEQGCENEVEERRDYNNTDNGKLRTLLRDRGLTTAGNREGLIARLEANPKDNYESLSASELTEMLKQRHITMAGQYTKEVKIQRLRVNDNLDRDIGDSEGSVLYGSLSVVEMIADDLESKQEKALKGENNYSSFNDKKLSKLLEFHKLSTSGSKEVQINRLQKHGLKTIGKNRDKAREKRDSVRSKLEARAGHSVNCSHIDEQESKQRAEDIRIEQQAIIGRGSPKRICDYNWKDSHWAERTERELSEICRRREMPGYGPKAAMIKWLDTGVVEYEDLYAFSLERICEERGVHYTSKDKKVDLVRKLKETDELDE
jgi:hypothetical protein